MSRGTDNVVSVLTELGLSLYEAKAYLTLLIRGIATASEISDLSGIPYTRVYDVLSSLESKGFVASIPGRPMKFQALDPDIALKNLLEMHKRKLMSELRTLEESVNKALGILSRLKPASRGYESIIKLRGAISIKNFIRQLIRKSSQRIAEVRSQNTPSVLEESSLDEARHKGVSVIKYVLKSTHIHVNLLIIDQSIIIYEREGRDSAGTYDSAVVINSKQISDLLYALILHHNNHNNEVEIAKSSS